MARLEWDMTSSAPPAAIIAALTDFTDRRPDIWPGLARDQYKVYEVGDTWAEIREGSAKSVWARERYDWSRPGNVTWTVKESSFSTPGDSVSADVSPGESGGSRIHVRWRRRGTSLGGKLVIALLVVTRGSLIKRSLRQGLARIETGGGPAAD
jgi:hypothetical protein